MRGNLPGPHSASRSLWRGRCRRAAGWWARRHGRGRCRPTRWRRFATRRSRRWSEPRGRGRTRSRRCRRRSGRRRPPCSACSRGRTCPTSPATRDFARYDEGFIRFGFGIFFFPYKLCVETESRRVTKDIPKGEYIDEGAGVGPTEVVMAACFGSVRPGRRHILASCGLIFYYSIASHVLNYL